MCMTRQLITVTPDVLLTDAAALMTQKKVRRLLVAEPQAAGWRLRGIVTANDILHAFPPDMNPFAVIVNHSPAHSKLTVEKIMQRHLHTAPADAPIEEAATMMRNFKISALPVMRDKQLVGIITESDIFRAFVGLFETQGSGARITFDVSSGEEDVFDLVVQLAKKHGVQVSSLFRTAREHQSFCVTRVIGEQVDSFLEEIWNSGHRVLNVIRFSPREGGAEQ